MDTQRRKIGVDPVSNAPGLTSHTARPPLSTLNAAATFHELLA